MSKFAAYCKLSSEMVPLNSNRFLEAHKLFFALSYINQCFEKISNKKCHQNFRTTCIWSYLRTVQSLDRTQQFKSAGNNVYLLDII